MHRVGPVLLAVLLACESGDPPPAAPVRPTTTEFQQQPAQTSLQVGDTTTPFVVLVEGPGGAQQGTLVTFGVSQGGGRLTKSADTTGPDGLVSTRLVIGTVPGPNEITASVRLTLPLKSAIITGVARPAQSLSLSTRSIRITASQDSALFTAQSRDAYFNLTGAAASWVSRDPALVTVAPGTGSNVVARVVSRPGKTWLVGSAGAGTTPDSVLVAVLDAASAACAFSADPVAMQVGEVRSFDGPMTLCVGAGSAREEYAVITHYSSLATSVAASVSLVASGIVAPTPAFPDVRGEPAGDPPEDAHTTFERGLRARERGAIGPYAAGARAWARSRPPALTAQPREGDLASVNTNPFDYCDAPTPVTARVVAVTDATVILADVSNPDGGLTDEEYRDLGRLIDTLVIPVDTTAFGTSTDIDGNGRIVILFTKAVNALTPRGSSGAALGYFYSRDLLPKQSAFGACAGSNAAEMFYVLVADPQGTVSDPRSKSFVRNVLVATIAHEYQHLINASRRLYVTEAPSIAEELWLNEGLSHVAEELVFFRATGLAPRQNVGPAALAGGSAVRAQYDQYQSANFLRFQQYVRAPETNSPIAENALLPTRGAAWAFLRYLADRAASGPTDGDFWRRIVDGTGTGVANVERALAGTSLTVAAALRDWGVAILLDDIVPSPPAPYHQPSWNYVGAFPQVGLNLWLVPSVLVSTFGVQLQLRAGSNAYARFAVAANDQALVLGGGVGQGVTPKGIRFSVVRIR